jgi:nicotinamide-nucleotide amidase
MLTDVAGISQVFVEGAVTYDNEAKIRRLGVSTTMLESHGAVSEAVARAMAEGIAERAGVEVGVAVTGIAGPGGGTAEKPLGTVFLAVRYGGATRVDRCRFRGDRSRIRLLASLTALDRVRRTITAARDEETRSEPAGGSFPFDIEIREC